MMFKKYLWFLLLLPFFTNCSKMYDNLEQYAGEVVYPGKYDTIVGKIGFERVELDLMKAGRIPSKRISLGNATKTIVEYDDETITIDSLVSWVSIPDLNQSKLYRFRVYTLDQFGNKSVPQEIALIPYTESDLTGLAIPSPKVVASPTAAVLSWPDGLSSILLDYYGLSYSYEDKDGNVQEDTRGLNPRIFMANLNSNQSTDIDLTYKIVPKVDGDPILDTVNITRTVPITIPDASTPFIPSEEDILSANGITTFTTESVNDVEKLTFPVYTNTLQDLFYFPNLKEVDLTGGDLFEMTTLSYNSGGIQKTIGGGSMVPFARNVETMSEDKAQYLLDLLDLGVLDKVKYIPHSLGIDELLEPYDQTGVIEYVDKPEEALIPLDRFFVDGLIQSSAFEMDLEIPANSYPTGSGLENVIKATALDRSAAFVITLPQEYQFDVEAYKFLRFKVYAPEKAAFGGIYAPFQRIWPRFMNYLWSFTGESRFGQEYWAPDANDHSIPDSDLENWIDMEVDLSSAVGKHNRVIVMNIGGEPSITFGTPSSPITYYFSNIRFSKE